VQALGPYRGRPKKVPARLTDNYRAARENATVSEYHCGYQERAQTGQ
jgi:hypothetical protein